MAYKKLKIICDADDVLISCNAYALYCAPTESLHNTDELWHR